MKLGTVKLNVRHSLHLVYMYVSKLVSIVEHKNIPKKYVNY